MRYIIIAIVGLAMLASCKPTEKNYQAAYDAAKAKREYVDPDQALLTGGHELLTDDATNWVTVGDERLQLMRVRLTPETGEWPEEGPYRLAVAMFKMDTNAKSLVEDLTGKKGYTPVAAKDGQGRHFIIVGSASGPEGLAPILGAFKKENPKFGYIGMTPARAAVIYSR